MDNANSTGFDAVWVCAIALLSGGVLQVAGVSAGSGLVIDWRTVTSGETLLANGDAFDTAQLFVALVGDGPAVEAVRGDTGSAAKFVAPAPRVTAFMPGANGGRRRSFEIGAFRVVVEPHEDDEAQAVFTSELAALAAQGDLA